MSNQIINNRNIKREAAENEKREIKEVSKVHHTTGEVIFVIIRQKLKLRMNNMRVKESRKCSDMNQ